MKIIPHVMRNINKSNIPADNSQDHEMLYFGVNQIIMSDYRLALNVLPDRSNYETEVFIMSRREVDKWKDRHDGFGYRCILL
jgi:hypothetical protein